MTYITTSASPIQIGSTQIKFQHNITSFHHEPRYNAVGIGASCRPNEIRPQANRLHTNFILEDEGHLGLGHISGC